MEEKRFHKLPLHDSLCFCSPALELVSLDGLGQVLALEIVNHNIVVLELIHSGPVGSVELPVTITVVF